MARPKSQRPPEKTDGIAAASVNHAALGAAGDAAAAHSREIAIAEKQFGIDVPYDRNLFVLHAKQLIGEVGLKSLQIGLIMIQIKAHESHGDFLAALDSIGVDHRFAQRAMQVARKFGGSEHRKQLANQLGIGKVLALLAEDDSSIDSLADGGELAGFTADEFAKMTKADVIAALKKERDEREEEKAADEEIIRKKDERINKLSRRSTRSSRRDEINELLADLHRAKVEVAANLKTMMDSVGAIESIYQEAGEQPEEDVQQSVESALEFANKWVHELADRLGE